MEKKEKVRRFTREELAIQLAKSRDTCATWVSGDEARRKEFAKAFAWFKEKNPFDNYSNRGDTTTPTWEQIFVKIGNLLAARNFMDFEGNISELEVAVEGMKENWNKYFEDKKRKES